MIQTVKTDRGAPINAAEHLAAVKRLQHSQRRVKDTII